MSLENKSIEEKTAQLNELVSWFDSDEFSIGSAMDKFKEAEKLANDIEKDLTSLKNEIQIVKRKFDVEE